MRGGETMATKKSSDGIRSFIADKLKLEQFSHEISQRF